MRILPLPRSVICCQGWHGAICLADWVNHQMLHSHAQGLCDRHEACISADFIIAKYWTA